MGRRRWVGVAAAGTLTLGLAGLSGGVAGATPGAIPEPAPGQAPGQATGQANAPVALDRGETALVRVQLPDRAMYHRLVATGADIASRPRTGGDATVVDLVLTGAQLTALVDQGAQPLRVMQRAGDGTRRFAGSASTAAQAEEDTLKVLQAYWWRSQGRTFLQTLVATTASDDPDVEITVTWRTADGTTGSFPLVRFSDADEYQYHVAEPVRVPGPPVAITATSSLGGTARGTPARWPGERPPWQPRSYQQDFIDAYMTPVDIRARIARLGRQYPDLVDVIDLPNRTHGYRRTASNYLGSPDTAAIVVDSVRYGDEGMNGVQVKTVHPGAPSRPLSAVYRDRVLTVQLATNRAGTVISTTDDVAAFISARYPLVFNAFVEEGSAGKRMPLAGPVQLTDRLSAPSTVPRAPWTVQALRIGKHRDGSRIGVLAYSQEHAREWATPLVTLEFAERLLANARTHWGTRRLLDEVDVFVIPTVNPDGANYSFYDYNFQRKNLHNYCTGQERDPAYRDYWGVDVNRNYTVGSVFDGYVGATEYCLSSVAAGTAELSEAESRNVIDLARANPNIRFAMNVHSYGGYFMWPPGAYKVPGRVALPRPSIDEAAYFLDSARRIVGAIRQNRGTVTWPSKTGPVVDVLYSAAGNSADQLYYELGIFAWDFEVGNELWNPQTRQWEGVGFQPPYPEAHAEAMEYADGLFELVRVARDYARAGGMTTRAAA